MDRSDFALLLNPEAQRLLGGLEYETERDVVRLVSELRAAGHSPELVAALLTQAKLRRRAATKFGEFASSMLFTEAGLEQASRLQLAALHAGRYRAAGITEVADLGCGIGAQSMAFAALGLSVTAVELDEVTAAAATFNLAPFDNATVLQADVTTLDLSGFESLFFDPARREVPRARGAAKNFGGRSRAFDPSHYSPSYDFVLAVIEGRAAAVKLGPGHPLEQIPSGVEAQWLSVRGELAELVLWSERLRREGAIRSALLIDRNGTRHELQARELPGDPEILPLGGYLYEPDAALIRSSLMNVLANQLGLTGISRDIAYLSSDRLVASPWLKRYRVLDVLPFDRKQLRAYLKERGVGVLDIKKRGVDVVPEELRAEMKLSGGERATLVVTRLAGEHRVIVVEPEPETK